MKNIKIVMVDSFIKKIDLKRLSDNVIYITMLISTILMFLGMHNNGGRYSIYDVNGNFLIFSLVYFYIFTNIGMYSIFFNTDKKYYIRKIILFYIIVFIVVLIDILALGLRNNYDYEYYDYENVLWSIVYCIFYVVLLLLSNIFIIHHIAECKKHKKNIKSFIKNLILYFLKSSIVFIVTFFIFGLVYAYNYSYRIVESIFQVFWYFCIVELFFLAISTFIFIIVYFVDVLNLYKISIKKFICVGVIILLLIPLFSFRSDLLIPIENIFVASGKYSVYDLRADNKIRSENERRKKQIEDEIDRFAVVSDIKNANIGQIVKFGKSFLKKNINSKIDNYYYVYDKQGDELTLLSLYIIDKVDYEDLLINDGEYKYKKYLDTVFYENAFSKDEKKLIVEKIYEDGKSHKVYVPNYKYFLYNKWDNSYLHKKAVSLLNANLQVYNKYMKNKHNNRSQNFGILLSESRLKKDSIRVAKYYYDYIHYTINERTISDYSIKNKEIDIDCYLRPIITVNISR